VAFSVILMMTGCVNDEEVAPSVEKDVNSIIQEYVAQLSIDRADIQQSSSMMAMESFTFLPNNIFQIPFNLKIDDLSFYYANVRMTEGSIEPESFNFSENLGVYQWDIAMQQFIRSGGEVDYIELEFPAIRGGQENNATLKILKYSEVDFTGIIDPSLGPVIKVTSFESELTINGNSEMTIHYNAGYDDSGNLRNVTMETAINPFELSLDLAQSNGVMQINSIWRKQEAPIFSSYFLIAKNNINFTPYDGFAFSGKTSGYIKYRELKLDGSFDFSMVEIENPDKEAAVQMSLYQGSRKLGKLYIDFQTDGEQVIPGTMQYFIEIQDKSRISADGLIEPLFEGFNSLK
jgi:hypothetical protein